MILAIIVILVIITMILLVYNFQVHKKIEVFKNLDQRVNSLNILQQFMNTLGSNQTIEEKLESINDILISKFAIKYSTIVIYDGAEYQIKASNVDSKHWSTLKNLQQDPVFGDSIKTAVPKYITVENESEKLPYQRMEFGRAKCAKFFPLYIDNIYIGYWIIEGSVPHEFDKQDDTILEVVKNNIVTIIKAMEDQSTIENIVRDDLYSGLKTVEYLYSKGKKTINKYKTSSLCLFKIINLVDINKEQGREVGNKTIIEISKFIKENLTSEYIFVRYMGPKFAIVFSGVDENGVLQFMNNLKENVERLRIKYGEEIIQTEEGEQIIENTISPKIKVAIATYYKGTSLDGAFKKMEEFIDSSNENDISRL